LLESELFGHLKGAFTGADANRTGVLVYANHGTVFLDEIGEMPLPVQAKVLRVLQCKEVTRLGENKPTPTDFRLICATNKDLKQCVEDGSFREDLYYRINAFTIKMPPLRKRKSDILFLAKNFLKIFSKSDRSTPKLSQGAASILVQYLWPGNVRELENVCERALVLSEGETITAFHLPEDTLSSKGPMGNVSKSGSKEIRRLVELGLTCKEVQNRMIKVAWERSEDNNVSYISSVLGLNRATTTKYLDKFGLRTKGLENTSKEKDVQK